jgi:hypothetical protein
MAQFAEHMCRAVVLGEKVYFHVCFGVAGFGAALVRALV